MDTRITLAVVMEVRGHEIRLETTVCIQILSIPNINTYTTHISLYM